MSIEENKQLARRSFELINARDIPALQALHVDDYVHHDPAFPGGGAQGWEAYVAAFGGFLTAFPDLQISVDDVAAEGDRVAVRWHWAGTNTGEFNGMPPTGRSVNVSAGSIHRVDGGRLVEGWVIFDAMAMAQQLGLTPAPAAV